MKKLLLLFFGLFISFQALAQIQLSNGEHIQARFIENKGQWFKDIRYRVQIPNGYLCIRDKGLIYHLYDVEKVHHLREHDHSVSPKNKRLTSKFEHPHSKEDSLIQHHIVYVDFVNGNTTAKKTGLTPSNEVINYYYGNDPIHWGEGIHPYTGIKITNIYPHIDFVIKQDKHNLKYEFVVKPGGDPKDIQLKYSGADSLQIQDRRLHFKTKVQEVVENEPYAYQNNLGRVDCSFHLENETVSFITGNFNRKEDFIIDPELIFSTYSGSIVDNWGNTACYDLDGNLFAGSTVFNYDGLDIYNPISTGFPRVGAFQNFFRGGDTDMGLQKYSPDGKSLLYSTYFGGLDADVPTSTITNSDGELFVLAITSSWNFPVSPNAFQRTLKRGASSLMENRPLGYSFNGPSSLAVVKLSSSGQFLKSTFVGGSSNDGIVSDNTILLNNYGDQLRGDIAIDKFGNILVTSTTYSRDFPTKNAYKPFKGDPNSDACVFSLTPDFSDLNWSTYLGGTLNETGMSLKVNDNGVYVTGGSTSSNFPTKLGSLNPSFRGNADAYVAQLSLDGSSLLSSTYLGTSSFDQGYFIELDTEGNAYILGQTDGNYPIESSGYSDFLGGIFIQKLDKNLSNSIFSTRILKKTNVNHWLSPTAFLVNECQNIFISGWGEDIDHFPSTSNAYQTQGYGKDFYLMVLEKGANSLLYGTFFGGSSSLEHVDGGTSRFDPKGIVYQAVCASCSYYTADNFGNLYPDNTAFPIEPFDVVSRTKNSKNCNLGVFKFNLAALEAEVGVKDTCTPKTILFENNSLGGESYYWEFGDGTSFSTTSKANISHTYPDYGIYAVRMIVTDLTTCKQRDTLDFNIRVNGGRFNESFDTTICAGDSVYYDLTKDLETPIISYQWTPDQSITETNNPNSTLYPKTTTRYLMNAEDSLGCVHSDTVDVEVTNIVLDLGYKLIGNCQGDPKIKFTNNSQALRSTTFDWDFGALGQSTAYTPELSVSTEDSLYAFVYAQNEYCEARDTISFIAPTVYIPNVVTPNGDGANDSFSLKNLGNSGNWDVQIFNRWGTRVFYDDSYSNNWNPIEQSPSTYYYLITSPDGTKCKGWVVVYP